MKKKLVVLLFASMALTMVLSGCGGNDSAGTAEESSSSISGSAATQALTKIDDESKAKMSSTKGIDVDLTVLSSTMVYSQVYDMMTKPENYKGQMVKMQGNFARYHDENADKNYFACIIQDATACCSQGIEFELAGEHTYPDDYPKENTEITVTGTFDTYKEGENTYCVLKSAKMH